MARFAAGAGFRWADRDPRHLRRLTLPWTRGRGVFSRNESWGWWRGVPVTVADVLPTGDGHRPSFTVAAVHVAADLPATFIAARTPRATRSATWLPEVNFGTADPRFAKRFVVRSADASFAARLISPEVRAWLLSTRGRFDVWLDGSAIAVAARVRRRSRAARLRARELPALLDALCGFCTRVPTWLWLEGAPSLGVAALPVDPTWPSRREGAAANPDASLSRRSRRRHLERLGGGLTLGGSALMVLAFLSVWYSVTLEILHRVERQTGVQRSGGVWLLVALTAIPFLVGAYSLLGGRRLPWTRAILVLACAIGSAAWIGEEAIQIRQQVVSFRGSPWSASAGPGLQIGALAAAVLGLGGVLLLVDAIRTPRFEGARIEETRTSDPWSRGVDRRLAAVPALASAEFDTPTKSSHAAGAATAPGHATPPAHATPRGPATAPLPPPRWTPGRVVWAVIGIGVAAVFVIATLGWVGQTLYREIEFARDGVSVAALVHGDACYSDNTGDDGGGDPCDLRVSFWVNGEVVRSVLTGVDDAPSQAAIRCGCIRLLYDRRHPTQVSTTSIQRPTTGFVWVGAAVAAILWLVIRSTIASRRGRGGAPRSGSRAN